jgi:hypothetical protein
MLIVVRRMNRIVKKTCVTVRRVGKHPLVSRTFRSGTLIRRHAIRSVTLGIVPATLNDVAFHHVSLNVAEVAHVVQDSVTLTTLNTVASILMIASKIPI